MTGNAKPEPGAGISLSTRSWLRFLTLCSLYVSQGLPQGFLYIALKNHLYELDYSLAEVGGMLSLISLPWTLKFLWGPVIDRFGIPSMGKRRPWLILAQGMTVLVLLGLTTAPNLEGSLKLIGWSILAMNVFIALQDVSTDSLAVDIVREEDRGKINGFMYGSSYLGSFLGGTFIGHFLLMEGGSIRMAFGVMAGCVFLIMLLPLLLRERPGEKLLPWSKGGTQLSREEQHAGSVQLLFRHIAQAFNRRVAICAAVLAVLAHVANSALANIGSQHFIKVVGWNSSDYSQLESFGYWFSLGGAVMGGFIADKLGAKRTVILAGSLLATTWIIFSRLEAFWGSRWLIGTNMYVLAVLIGLMSVSMFTLFMNIADRRVTASQFTAYMALLNLSIFTGNRIASWFREVVATVPTAYLMAGLFHLGVVLFVAIAIKIPPPGPTTRD